jgi:predicted Zn-dependent protease
MDRYRSLVLIPILVLSFFGAACATNPAMGQHQFSLMSEDQELQIGRQQDVEVRRQMGVYADPATQQYVSDVGVRLARESERPNLPWHFTVVDVPAINAFALPVQSMQRAGFRPLDGEETTVNGLPTFIATYQGTIQDLGRVRLRAAHIVMNTHAIADEPRPGERLKVVV